MKKLVYMFKEAVELIKKHKVYFFAPIIIFLVFLGILVFILGPTAIMTFIYAGM